MVLNPIHARLKDMIIASLISALLLIQNWWDWINNDPVGRNISTMIFVAVFSLVMYFVCSPLMLRKLQDTANAREMDVDEWKTDA